MNRITYPIGYQKTIDTVVELLGSSPSFSTSQESSLGRIGENAYILQRKKIPKRKNIEDFE